MDNYRRVSNAKATTYQNHDQELESVSTLDKMRQKFALIDLPIMFVMTLLIIISFIMVFSSTMHLKADGLTAPNPFSFMLTQAGAAIGGFIALGILVALKYKFYENIILLNMAMAILVISLLALTVIGSIGGGAQSWISLGFASFQPSEVSKVASILIVSRLLQDQQREVVLSNEQEISNKMRNISILLITTAVLLILAQPDLGMVILIVGSLIILVAQQYLSVKLNASLYILIGTGIVVLNAFSRLASDWLVNHPSYQLNRIGSFTNPFLYPQSEGYQLINGYLAFSRGGWFGVGIGQGVTKRFSLPAGHTDFILANIGEETGLLGVSLVIGLLFVLIFMIYRWAAQSVSDFRRNVLFGIATLFLVQTFVNLGGIAGVIPLTGVTLPFVSYGGSSMLVSIFTIGIAQVMIIEEKQQAKRAVEKRLKEEYEQTVKTNERLKNQTAGLTLVHSRKQEK